MKALPMALVLLLASIPGVPETSQAQPALRVDVADVMLRVHPPRAGDSVVVEVYLDNMIDPIGAFDAWLSLDHNEIFVWDTVNTYGSSVELWELVEACVIDSQIHVIGDADIGGGYPPIPPGEVNLLMFLVARVRSDRLDPDGTVVDSMCDEPYFGLYGVTAVHVDSALFWTDDSTELIGWDWRVFCADSSCTEWDGDSCIAWECTEWDSVYECDSNEVYFFDGSITLDCEVLDYICGDPDNSGSVDIDDVVYLVVYIFAGGPSPYQYYSGDANCSIWIDVDDVVYLIEYIFSGGTAPCDTDGDGVPDC